MASSSTQAVAVPERKPVEASEPRPVSRPASKPFTVKIECSIPT